MPSDLTFSRRPRPSLFPLRLVDRALNAVARIAGGSVPRGVKGRAFASRPTLNSTRPFLVLFVLATACFFLFLHTTTAPSNSTVLRPLKAAQHPSFDFDAEHLAPHGLPFDEEREMREGPDMHDDAAGQNAEEEESVGDLGEEEELVDELLEDEALGSGPTRLHPSLRHSNSQTSLPHPFLPFSCEPCSTLSPSHPAPPTCAKYSRPRDSPASPFNPTILDRAALFPGSGSEVQRVLKRAMKSSLYGAKRAREGAEASEDKFEDEDPFRILVLGGSVSNCRGVDEKTACWHAHMLRWFQQTLPMEGDHDLVPPSPHADPRTSGDGVQRLGAGKDKARMAKRAVEIINLPPKRKSTGKKKSNKSKKKTKKPKHRGQPLTRLINASKSATGSAFFAYCLEQELTARRKNVEWGKGPDLVVIEVGINDVWPLSEVATRDFEKLLRTLRAMPSSPAIIILEAASLLLAQTTSFTSNAEYLHLPAAQFYDVPILSAKQALFGPTPALLPSSGLKIEDIFLPDLHHPNDHGHELLGDLLITYLERQACEVQAEILSKASERIRGTDALAVVDAELDIERRKEEAVLPLPHRSLFDPFNPAKLDEYTLPKPTCLQIGNDKSTVVPKSNTGWSKYAWARDKQYLVAEKPGSKVTFDVVVGEGGSILVDHLRSRFYNLGNVLVYLDGERSRGQTIEGYWDLGWSIGVPTEVFTGVKAGPHTVTFELLGPSLSSHPSKKTVFRLIGLITT